MRDYLDNDRFVQVSIDGNDKARAEALAAIAGKMNGRGSPVTTLRTCQSNGNLAANTGGGFTVSHSGEGSNSSSDLAKSGSNVGSGSEEYHEDNDDNGGTLESHPPPLPSQYWEAPPPNLFFVRGKNYKVDRKKINAGKAAFRLIVVDVIETDSPMLGGICQHPTERVQRALRREAAGDKTAFPPFVVVINIALPGPPFYHAIMMLAIDDMSMIDGTDGTEFSNLCQQFFFGESDEFRDKTFKLIPQIVEGNFIVRRAVGSTPAILGTKLKQSYVRNDRFFELICDVGSSSVAAGVVRLSVGYAKTLTVDMAFVLQGDKEEHLPEKVFGACRMKNLDFEEGFRFVPNY